MKIMLFVYLGVIVFGHAGLGATALLPQTQAMQASFSNNARGRGAYLRDPATNLAVSNTNISGVRLPIHIPVRTPILIPGTPVTLIVTSLGEPVPAIELGAGLTTALSKIQPSVKDNGDVPIPDHQFWYRDKVTHIWFLLIVTPPKAVTWQQLSWILAAFLHWMKNDRCRELSYEIEVDGQGYVGFGNLGHDPVPPRISASHGEVHNG